MNGDSLGVTTGTGDVTLVLDGQLTFTTAAGLDERIRAVVGPDVVLDVAGVSFCDSVGLAVLIGSVRRARRRGGAVTLLGATPTLLRLLQISGVGALFTVQTGQERDAAYRGRGEPA